MSKTTFKLAPLNAREAQYYPEGSQELIRRQGGATPQVWVVTSDDVKTLFTLLAKEVVK